MDRSSTYPKDRMRRLASVGALLVLALVVSARAQDGGAGIPSPETRVIRIAYVFSDGNLPGTLKAFKSVLRERPDLRGRVALSFLTESVMSDVKAEEISRANVLVLDTMNQQMLERFNAAHTVDLIGQVRGHSGK